jgi:hypothetical protein
MHTSDTAINRVDLLNTKSEPSEAALRELMLAAKNAAGARREVANKQFFQNLNLEILAAKKRGVLGIKIR